MKNETGNFTCFYEILESALKGKRIRLRSLKGGGGFPEYDMVLHKKCKPTEANHHNDEEVIGWNNKVNYLEWSGTVKKVLQNDNSHVDIIFDQTKPHTYPGKGYYEDCYNWHMGDHVELLP